MKKEITLQDLANSMEENNKAMGMIAATMHTEFGRVHKRMDDLEDKIEGVRTELTEKIEGVRTELTEKIEGARTELTEKIEGVRIELTNKIEGVRTELTEKIESARTEATNKIENSIEELALMTKRGFDEMTGNFNEVHEELAQIKNNVIGIDRRVTKLEKLPIAK